MGLQRIGDRYFGLRRHQHGQVGQLTGELKGIEFDTFVEERILKYAKLTNAELILFLRMS